MNQTLTQNPPPIDQQIGLVRGARHLIAKRDGTQVILTEEHSELLMRIEENLLALKIMDIAHAKTPTDLVIGVGKRMAELVKALKDAKLIIKDFHAHGNPESDAMWSIYEKNAPEMIRLNAIIKKYEEVCHD